MAVEITCDIDGVEEFQATMQQFDSGMQRWVHSQLASWIADVKALAKQLVPVRTGYLRSTIYARVQEWVAVVGADAPYALYVEFGTRYMQARPYLYPAIERHLPRLENIIVEALEQAASEAGL
ncbi:MAG: HK97 gp10 family phage protein [Candidatus Bathyarchaeia archaeon]